jgi:hypothetical protein
MGMVNGVFRCTLNALGDAPRGGLCDRRARRDTERSAGIGPTSDVEDPRFVLLWGCDFARTAQHLQPALQPCRRGVLVIAIDIYRTGPRALERRGRTQHPYPAGTDAALAVPTRTHSSSDSRRPKF